jgi:hypothetical protein
VIDPSAAAASSCANVTNAIATHGFTVVELGDDALVQIAQPWRLVLALVGRAPELTEVQPIAPRGGPDPRLTEARAAGRSFAASTGDAPLHTDSQLWRGRPPELQITACMRPAATGGHSVLVDGHALADAVAEREPALLQAMLREPRRMPFVFGSVYGPTLARRDGRYVVTHTPRPVATDAVAARISSVLERVPHHTIELRRGQVLLVDNHRMLHGRTAFTDPTRALLRVLAWLPSPLGPRPAWADAADAEAEDVARVLGDASAAVRLAFGITSTPPDPIDLAVLAIAGGAPPGALAQRLGIAEAALYRRRDALLGPPAAADAVRDELAGAPGANAAAVHDDAEAACTRALERLLGRPVGVPKGAPAA